MFDQFPTNIVFVQKDLNKWKNRIDINDAIKMESVFEQLDSGTDNWIFQTYALLLKAGLNVEIVENFVPNALCIAHYDHLKTPPPFNSYVVSVKADRDRTFTCQSEIIQSPSSKECELNFFLPHWPQPNLIARDESRGSEIKRIGYFGEAKYLPPRFKSTEFIEKLKKMGIEFVEKSHNPDWADYSDIDIVFAVRDATPHYLASKPASKLVNAWLAKCPALVGEEPIFNYYKKSDLDYFQVISESDFFKALNRLISQPSIYTAMVNNGIERVNEVDRNAVLQVWVNTINTKIIPDYESWLRRSKLSKIIQCHLQRFRKRIRGHLNDVGFNQATGEPMDRTTMLRKILWLIFDRYAWKQYSARKQYFKNHR
jgi:hypothetical protein